jgi:hypothetical protein
MVSQAQGDRGQADSNSGSNRRAYEDANKRQDRHAAQQDTKRRI